MSNILCESERITSVSHGIWALLNHAQVVADAVTANQSPPTLATMAAAMRPLLEQTINVMNVGTRSGETLPAGSAGSAGPEYLLVMVGTYLEETILAMESRQNKEQVSIHVQALVDTLKDLQYFQGTIK